MCKLLDERYLIAYTYTASLGGIRWQIIRISNTPAAAHTAPAAAEFQNETILTKRNRVNLHNPGL